MARSNQSVNNEIEVAERVAGVASTNVKIEAASPNASMLVDQLTLHERGNGRCGDRGRIVCLPPKSTVPEAYFETPLF
jgi:hypothetical protein